VFEHGRGDRSRSRATPAQSGRIPTHEPERRHRVSACLRLGPLHQFHPGRPRSLFLTTIAFMGMISSVIVSLVEVLQGAWVRRLFTKCQTIVELLSPCCDLRCPASTGFPLSPMERDRSGRCVGE